MKKIYLIFIILGMTLNLVSCNREKIDISNYNIVSKDSVVVSKSDEISTIEEKPYEFEFNPYVLTSEYEKLYGDEFIEAYKNFVFAYLNYENYSSCPNIEHAYLILSI